MLGAPLNGGVVGHRRVGEMGRVRAKGEGRGGAGVGQSVSRQAPASG